MITAKRREGDGWFIEVKDEDDGYPHHYSLPSDGAGIRVKMQGDVEMTDSTVNGNEALTFFVEFFDGETSDLNFTEEEFRLIPENARRGRVSFMVC